MDAGTSGLDQAELAKIQPILQAALDTGGLSGIMTMIWHRGEVVQFNALGKRDVEAGLPMTRDTVFRIASMTKPVTSVAALQLLEEGKLKLDDPITKWAPEFADMRVLNDPKSAITDINPAARDITIDDLMTHRSGIAYAFSAQGAYRDALDNAVGNPFGVTLTPDQWMKALGALPLITQPGSHFHYGHSTDVLGIIIGRIEGMSFADVLRKRIFDPLGMSNTDFWVHPEWRPRMAGLYTHDAEANVLKRLPEVPFASAPAFAAGGQGLVSTIDDYLQFARVMVRGGEYGGVRLLKPETATLMRTNRLTDAQRQIPFLGMDAWWKGQGFGLGVSVIMDPAQHMMGVGPAGAFGWPGIYGTSWQADPSTDTILIYWVQNSSMLGGDGRAAAVAGQAPSAAGMPARIAQPLFQRAAYAAIQKAK